MENDLAGKPLWVEKSVSMEWVPQETGLQDVLPWKMKISCGFGSRPKSEMRLKYTNRKKKLLCDKEK